ncbi:MAG TPA: hypothetical protein VK169_14685 [Saprospiraceae bacterium]|nr:hypothetical protein [Saprospiraceae bacterium]
MIVVLDDTFEVRHKFSDVSYLEEEKYQSVAKIIEKPTKKDFRELIGNCHSIQLLCNHRSLKLFNDNLDIIDGKEAIINLFNQIQTNNLTRLEFGRDMHSNLKAKTLDKDIFYSNLKPFLDHLIDNGQIEIKILFYGIQYQELEFLSAVNQMMDEINFTALEEYKNNTMILHGLELLYPEKEPLEILNEWKKKELTKKEILSIINNKI